MTSTYFSIKLRCFILFQLPTMLASLVRHIPSTLFSFPSTANYVSSIQPCCYFLYQRPATLASLVRHFPTTLLSSLSTAKYVNIPCKTSSKYVVIFSINFQLRYHLWSAFMPLRCYLVCQLPTTFLMSLSGKTLAPMWPNLGAEKKRFHVPKPWPHCHFAKRPTKNWVLFRGWNVHIWWPAHRKTITLLRVIPTHDIYRFVTGKSSGILSDISSGIRSGIPSGILPGISSGICSGISSAILIWQIFWHSIWQTFWHTF